MASSNCHVCRDVRERQLRICKETHKLPKSLKTSLYKKKTINFYDSCSKFSNTQPFRLVYMLASRNQRLRETLSNIKIMALYIARRYYCDATSNMAELALRGKFIKQTYQCFFTTQQPTNTCLRKSSFFIFGIKAWCRGMKREYCGCLVVITFTKQPRYRV